MSTQLSTTQQATLTKADVVQTMRRLVDDWLSDPERAYSSDTQKAYRRSVDLFLAWLETHWTDDVSRYTVGDWKQHLDGAISTINLRLTAVRQYLGWLSEQGYIQFNPARDVKGHKRKGTTKSHKRDDLSTAELQALASVLSEDDSDVGIRDRAMISLMVNTGTRTVEVTRANVGDLANKGDRRVLWVHGKKRSEADEYVVIDRAEPKLLDWLAIHPEPENPEAPLFVSLSRRNYGDRLSRVTIRQIVKARYQEAGIHGRRKTTHSLRHTAITRAIDGGADPRQTQGMARHASLETTMVYYHERGREQDPAEDYVDLGADL